MFLYHVQVADALRSHGMPVRLVTFMENTPHGIRRALTKVRKMSEIRGQYSFKSQLTCAQLDIRWSSSHFCYHLH